MKLTAIFDIGKTNKKFFLFDEAYKEVHRSYVRFEEKKDLEGFPCDDLYAIQDWIKTTLSDSLKIYGERITTVNFSTYGASFVHIDKDGNPLTPLINYLKPFPKKLLKTFYEKYGDAEHIAKETSSPQLGNLNSGMQLYWLKYEHPEIYKKVQWSLHFPQYLSYLFTNIPLSEYTSIGCHTGLWDFSKNDYHQWVYEEEIDQILPQRVSTSSSTNSIISDYDVKIGVGIHDSSSALIPYLQEKKNSFLLISTGTWSVALNPFNKEILTKQDLDNDCLSFLQIQGDPVKAARLFLGNEYNLQVRKIQNYFNVDKDAHKQIVFNEIVYNKLKENTKPYFCFETLNIQRDQPQENLLSEFLDFEKAYVKLMIELMELQVAAIHRVMDKKDVDTIYIDGGFSDNSLFVNIIAMHFPSIKIRTTKSPLGSALGAAIVVSNKKVENDFLVKNYGMQDIRKNPENSLNIKP